MSVTFYRLREPIRHERGDGVADLPILRGLRPLELEPVGEALKPGALPNREPPQLRRGRFVFVATLYIVAKNAFEDSLQLSCVERDVGEAHIRVGLVIEFHLVCL